LVAAFFASHDPTRLNRQGPDAVTQYRSIALYNNRREKEILEKEIARINTSGKYKSKIVTQLIPSSKFYPAEAYHQEYIYHNPGNSYVRNVNLPDYYHFRKEFKGPFCKRPLFPVSSKLEFSKFISSFQIFYPLNGSFQF